MRTRAARISSGCKPHRVAVHVLESVLPDHKRAAKLDACLRARNSLEQYHIRVLPAVCENAVQGKESHHEGSHQHARGQAWRSAAKAVAQRSDTSILISVVLNDGTQDRLVGAVWVGRILRIVVQPRIDEARRPLALSRLVAHVTRRRSRLVRCCLVRKEVLFFNSRRHYKSRHSRPLSHEALFGSCTKSYCMHPCSPHTHLERKETAVGRRLRPVNKPRPSMAKVHGIIVHAQDGPV